MGEFPINTEIPAIMRAATVVEVSNIDQKIRCGLGQLIEAKFT